jgi:hypothetical protein
MIEKLKASSFSLRTPCESLLKRVRSDVGLEYVSFVSQQLRH